MIQHPAKLSETALVNRRPYPEEVKRGQRFLNDIISIFAIRKIVAVGRVAEGSLLNSGMKCRTIRHPAHGEANEFIQGLFEIMK